MEFHKRLSVSTPRREGRLRIFLVGRQTETTLANHVGQHDLEIDGLMNVESDENASLVTPTLALVDTNGTVRHVWRGQQPPDGEAAVVAAIS